METIRKLELPEPKGPRHHPFGHADFVDTSVAEVKRAKYEIMWEEHAISHEGNRYFGLMGIAPAGDELGEYERVLGLRNAHDQTFAGQMVAGTNVFVCDNLCFSGEVKVGRKHTLGFEADIGPLMADAMSQVGAQWANHAQRVDAYKDRSLSREEVHDLVCEAARGYHVGDKFVRGCLPSSKILPVLDEYHGTVELDDGKRGFRHEEFTPRTVWSLSNAYTEVAKAWRLESLQPRTKAMYGLLDKFVGHTPLKTTDESGDFDPNHGHVVVEA